MHEPIQIAPGPPGGKGHDPTGLPPTPEEVYEESARRVYSLARRLLGNAADAQDVTQDVFVRVLRGLPTFRGEAAFSTWIYRITVNTALDYRGKRALREQRHVPEPPEDFGEDGTRRTPTRPWVSRPEQELLDREAHQRIEEAVAGLPEIYRDVYVLADVEDLSNAEIAALLGLSVAAVKSRLHCARLLMRQALAPYFEERAA